MHSERVGCREKSPRPRMSKGYLSGGRRVSVRPLKLMRTGPLPLTTALHRLTLPSGANLPLRRHDPPTTAVGTDDATARKGRSIFVSPNCSDSISISQTIVQAAGYVRERFSGGSWFEELSSMTCRQSCTRSHTFYCAQMMLQAEDEEGRSQPLEKDHLQEDKAHPLSKKDRKRYLSQIHEDRTRLSSSSSMIPEF